MLIQIINEWLHSNPYLVPGYEVRRANQLRFDIIDRKTQNCKMHLVFGTDQMHFWRLDRDEGWPTDLLIIGYINDNFVAFEDINEYEEWGKGRSRGPGENKMSPADPKFFNWLEDNLKQIVKAVYVDPV